MRVDEIRRREPTYETDLAATLGAFWRARFGGAVGDVIPGRANGQHWSVHGLLSGYTHRPGPAARRWLADQFRHTRVRRRRAAQWCLGTALASPAGLRIGGRPGFTVTGAVPNANATLVIPGNRRFRLLDFDQGRTWSVLKARLPAQLLTAELDVRVDSAGPWLPITAQSDGSDSIWIEEPIFPGVPLPRCVDDSLREPAERAALAALDAWRRAGSREIPVAEWADHLAARVRKGCARSPVLSDALAARLARLLERLVDVVDETPRISIGPSHGDLQPGNILAGRTPGEYAIVDWEYVGERALWYDAVCFATNLRHPTGLAERLLRWSKSAGARRAVAATLAEELVWRVEDVVAGDFSALPTALTILVAEGHRLISMISPRA